MAKTGHPNFDYTCQGYWRGKLHSFSITGNHSGTSFGASDAQTFMEGASSPYHVSFAPFQATDITVIGSRYYDGQNSAPVYAAEYNTDSPAPAPLTATALGYTDSGGANYLPLEVCLMLRAVVGTSKTSKPIECLKYLRGVPVDALGTGSDGSAVFEISAAGVAAAAGMGNASWYGDRYYISPSARQANSAGWTASTLPGNHQIPRGRKRTASGDSSSLLASAEKLIALAGGIALAGA